MEAVKTWPEGSLNFVKSRSMWPRQGLSSLKKLLFRDWCYGRWRMRTHVRTNSIPWVSWDDSADSMGWLFVGLCERGSWARDSATRHFVSEMFLVRKGEKDHWSYSLMSFRGPVLWNIEWDAETSWATLLALNDARAGKLASDPGALWLYSSTEGSLIPLRFTASWRWNICVSSSCIFFKKLASFARSRRTSLSNVLKYWSLRSRWVLFFGQPSLRIDCACVCIYRWALRTCSRRFRYAESLRPGELEEALSLSLESNERVPVNRWTLIGGRIARAMVYSPPEETDKIRCKLDKRKTYPGWTSGLIKRWMSSSFQLLRVSDKYIACRLRSEYGAASNNNTVQWPNNFSQSSWIVERRRMTPRDGCWLWNRSHIGAKTDTA